MLKIIGTLLVSAVFFISLSSFDTIAVTKDWEKLGSKNVNYKLDRDVIAVGLQDGLFTKLKLAVTGGSLNMHKMWVHYANGTKQEIELRHNFSRRSTSRVIDLKGNKRIITKVTFIYDTKNFSGKKAKIHLFGKH
ncbi:MAG: DUF2541 family protein [Flavobacteriaceae bacterium]|nr:DUF2541 family protein [Flavobacteriaceae bacterium]